MISRIVHCHVNPDKIQEFRNTLNQKLVPRIERQNGFVDLIESIDTNTGTFVCNTLWKDRSYVEKYDQGLFQEIAKTLTPYLTEAPTVETLQVENSSMHDINAGMKTAAA